MAMFSSSFALILVDWIIFSLEGAAEESREVVKIRGWALDIPCLVESFLTAILNCALNSTGLNGLEYVLRVHTAWPPQFVVLWLKEWLEPELRWSFHDIEESKENRN